MLSTVPSAILRFLNAYAERTIADQLNMIPIVQNDVR